MKLSAAYTKAIGKYQPLEIDGLTLHPILVDEYHDFLTARPAIEAMQQSFPVKYAAQPLLSAYYAMDYDLFMSGQPVTGYFYRVLLFLALSLRLGAGLEAEDRVKLFQPVPDRTDPSKLVAVCFASDDGGEPVKITPVMFAKLRPVLAAQNGLDLIDDAANPELIEAEQDLAELNAARLSYDFFELRASVAALSGCDEAEIDTWPILKFQHRYKALKRAMDYMVNAIGTMQGVKWKGGNPVPHPFYERQKEGTSALMPLGDFANGAGERAVAQTAAGSQQGPLPPEIQLFK